MENNMLFDTTIGAAYTVGLGSSRTTEADVRRINPQIADLLGQHNISIAEFAERAGVSRSTIHALINPSQHPERIGGMYPKTAWKLARAYAEITGTTPEQGYRSIIIESTESRRIALIGGEGNNDAAD